MPLSDPIDTSYLRQLISDDKEPSESTVDTSLLRWYADQESAWREEQEAKASKNKRAAELARDAINTGKDEDYNYSAALRNQRWTGKYRGDEQTLYDPVTDHWASRIPIGPDEGLLLKSPKHESYREMIEEELNLGNVIISKGNKEYSMSPEEAEKFYTEEYGEDGSASAGWMHNDKARREHHEYMIDRTGSATGQVFEGHRDDGTFGSVWGEDTEGEVRDKNLQRAYNKGLLEARLGLAPIHERVFGEGGAVSDYTGQTIASIVSGYTSGALKSSASSMAWFLDTWAADWLLGTFGADTEWKGGIDEWAAYWSGSNVGMSMEMRPEGWFEETSEMITQSAPATLSGIVAGVGTTFLTANPAAGYAAGVSTSGVVGGVMGASAATTRLDMYEHEQNAILMLQGYDPTFKISESERTRIMMEFAVAESGFEMLGNAVGMGLIVKGLRTASGKMVSRELLGAGASPSGKVAFTQAMRNAYVRTVTAKTTRGAIARFAPMYAAEVGMEGITEGLTEIAQTASISRVDPDAWKHLDVWGAVKDGMLLGMIMGSPMTVFGAYQEISGRDKVVHQYSDLALMLDSERDDSIRHWRIHHAEQIAYLESLTPEQRDKVAAQWGTSIAELHSEIAKLDKQIEAEMSTAGDPETAARLTQAKGKLQARIGRLHTQLAFVEDVQTGRGEKVSINKSTPKGVIAAKNNSLTDLVEVLDKDGNVVLDKSGRPQMRHAPASTTDPRRLKVSKAENKHEQRAEAELTKAGYEVVWYEGGGEFGAPAFYDPSTQGTVYLQKSNAVHWKNFLSLGMHEAIHDMQYYNPALYNALTAALGSGEILTSASEYLASTEKPSEIDMIGASLLIHLANGGTLENFTGDTAAAVTYLEQEGVAVAVEQGQAGGLGTLLSRFGIGTKRGKANSMLLLALQKGAAKTQARRESAAERAEVSEFGARQRREVSGRGVRQAAKKRKLLEARRLKKKKPRKKAAVAPPPKFETVEELFAPLPQKITSEKTDLKQVPRLFKLVDWVKGEMNADIGGGVGTKGTAYLKDKGVTNHVIDPFNRTADQNREAIEATQNGQADTATVANTLNTVQEKAVRRQVIAQASNVIKEDGAAYFTMYEGDRSGKGKKTKRGWQENRKLADYASEIEEYFNSVEVKGGMITAMQPSMEARDLFTAVKQKAAARVAADLSLTEMPPMEYLKGLKENEKAYDEAGIKLTDFTMEPAEHGAIRAYGIPAIDAGYALRTILEDGFDGYEVVGAYNNEASLRAVLTIMMEHAKQMGGGKPVRLGGVLQEAQLELPIYEDVEVKSLIDLQQEVQKESKGKGKKGLGKELSAVGLLPTNEYYELETKLDELENEIPEVASKKREIEEYDMMRKAFANEFKKTGNAFDEKLKKKFATKHSNAIKALERMRNPDHAKYAMTDEIASINTRMLELEEEVYSQLGLPVPLLKSGKPSRKLRHKGNVLRPRLDIRAQSIIGIVAESDKSVEDIMANAMIDELLWAHEHGGWTAKDWYADSIETLWKHAVALEPSLKRNSEEGILFTMMLALMSNGENIDSNLKLALEGFRYYKRTGKFPAKGTQLRKVDFSKIETLLAYFGSWKKVDEWMRKKSTIKEVRAEINSMAKERPDLFSEHLDEKGKLGKSWTIGNELAGEVGWNALVIGPKLGAFYLNNRGIFEPVTQDIWFSRSFYRLKGLSTLPNAQFQRTNVNRLVELVASSRGGQLSKAAYSADKARQKAQTAMETVKESDWGTDKTAGFHPDMLDNFTELLKWIDKARSHYGKSVKSGGLGFKADTHVEKLLYTIANEWGKKQAKGREAPSSGDVRAQARRVVLKATKEFNKRTGMNIQPAAAQAMLWYFEKELYTQYSSERGPFGQDYGTVAQELVAQENFLTTFDPATMEARKLDSRDLTQKLGPASMYPKIVNVLGSMRQRKMPADQLKKYLVGKGITSEEMFWTGVDAFIERQEKGVSLNIDDVQAAVVPITLNEVTHQWDEDALETYDSIPAHPSTPMYGEFVPPYFLAGRGLEDEIRYIEVGDADAILEQVGEEAASPVDNYKEILLTYEPELGAEGFKEIVSTQIRQGATRTQLLEAALLLDREFDLSSEVLDQLSFKLSINMEHISEYDPVEHYLEDGQVAWKHHDDNLSQDGVKRFVDTSLVSDWEVTEPVNRPIEYSDAHVARRPSIWDMLIVRAPIHLVPNAAAVGGWSMDIDKPITPQAEQKLEGWFVDENSAPMSDEEISKRFAVAEKAYKAGKESWHNFLAESHAWLMDEIANNEGMFIRGRYLTELTSDTSFETEMQAKDYIRRKMAWYYSSERLRDEGLVQVEQVTEQVKTMGGYQSPHWLGTSNIFAHIRTLDWQIEFSGKYLFVLEAQSDWANESQRAGFDRPAETVEVVELPTKDGAFILQPTGDQYYVDRDAQVYNSEGEELDMLDATDAEYNLISTVAQTWEGRTTIELDLYQTSAPPMAPFVATPAGKTSDAWLGVVVKRLIAEAAANGYDGLAITSKDFANTTSGIGLGEDYTGYTKMASILRKIGKKLDPDAKFTADLASLHGEASTFEITEIQEQHYGTAEEFEYPMEVSTPSGAALQITDKIRDSVEKGMPMFGSTTMEARKDIGLRIQKTASLLRRGQPAIQSPFFDELSKVISGMPIQQFADANKLDYLSAYWDFEIEPLIHDYVHSWERAYDEWYLEREKERGKRKRGPAERARELFLEFEPLWEEGQDADEFDVPDNEWAEMADNFPEGKNRDATPILTLLELGKRLRFLFTEALPHRAGTLETLIRNMSREERRQVLDEAGYTGGYGQEVPYTLDVVGDVAWVSTAPKKKSLYRFKPDVPSEAGLSKKSVHKMALAKAKETGGSVVLDEANNTWTVGQGEFGESARLFGPFPILTAEWVENFLNIGQALIDTGRHEGSVYELFEGQVGRGIAWDNVADGMARLTYGFALERLTPQSVTKPAPFGTMFIGRGDVESRPDVTPEILPEADRDYLNEVLDRIKSRRDRRLALYPSMLTQPWELVDDKYEVLLGRESVYMARDVKEAQEWIDERKKKWLIDRDEYKIVRRQPLEQKVALEERERMGVAPAIRTDDYVHSYAPMEAFQKATSTEAGEVKRFAFKSPTRKKTTRKRSKEDALLEATDHANMTGGTVTLDEKFSAWEVREGEGVGSAKDLWVDTLGFSYEDRPKNMKVDAVYMHGRDVRIQSQLEAYVVRTGRSGKYKVTILHLTPAGGFRNAQVLEFKKAKEIEGEVENIIRDINFPIVQEAHEGLSYRDILMEDTAMHARRLDGSKRMVSITATKMPHISDLVMGVRSLVMPSVATLDTRFDLPFFETHWSFGDVFLVWDPDAIRPETGVPTFTGDAYSARFPELGLVDGVHRIMEEPMKGWEATPENLHEWMLKQQEERGGIRGAEVQELTHVSTGLMRSTVLDEPQTTEEMRGELEERQVDVNDTFRKHQSMFNDVISMADEWMPTTAVPDHLLGIWAALTDDSSNISVTIYETVRKFFKENPKPKGVLYRDYLAQPEIVESLTGLLSPEIGTDAANAVVEMLRDMSTGATRYFETKPQEIMRFGKGGVVAVLLPKSSVMGHTQAVFQKRTNALPIVEELKSMGVQVEFYDFLEAKQSAGETFVEQLDGLEDSVMYARKLPATRTSILNSPALGILRRMEAEDRGITPADRTPFESGFRSGARSLLSLERQRAKEERKYAVETERERGKLREARRIKNQRELLERRINRAKLKSMEVEQLRESAITLVKLLPKRLRGDLAIRLARVTTPNRLAALAERAVELATEAEYKAGVRRLRTLKRRFRKRKVGMTNEVRQEVNGLITAAELQAYQTDSTRMLPVKGGVLKPEDALVIAEKVEDFLNEAVEVVKAATLEYRSSRENRASRLGKIAGDLIDAVEKNKERPPHTRGTKFDRRGSTTRWWFRISQTTLSIIEELTQKASPEVAIEIADALHHDIADAESNQLSEVRRVFAELDKLAKAAGYKNFDALLDAAGTTDIEAVTKTVKVTLGGETIELTLDELMKIAATDEESVSIIVDELDIESGEIVKQGTGIQFKAGRGVSPTTGITRAEWEEAAAQLPKELATLVSVAKQVREDLRGPAFEAYFQIHGTEPAFVVGYEPRSRQQTAAQRIDSLDVPRMTEGFMDEAGFTKKRAAGGGAVMIGGFLDDFIRSIEGLSKLAHMAVPVRDAISIVGNQEVRDAINTHFGAQFATDLENRLLHAAGMAQRTPEGVLGGVSRGLTRAYLTISPKTWGRILFGGISNLTIQMSIPRIMVGLSSLVNIKANLEDAWNNSGYLYARSRSGAMRRQTQEAEQTAGRIADQDYLMASVVKISKSLMRGAEHLLRGDVSASMKSLKDVLREIYRLPDSIHVLQALDNVIVAIAYGAYLSEYHAQGLRGDALKKAAAVAAERIMRQTQNTSSAVDATVLDANDAVKGKQYRVFFPFSSDPLTKANAVYRAMRFGNMKQRALAVQGFTIAIAVNVGVTFGYGMLLKFIADLFRDDEPDELERQSRAIIDRANKMRVVDQTRGQVVEDILGQFGYMGIMASWLMSAAEGYDVGPSQLWSDAWVSMGKDISRLVNVMTKEDAEEGEVSEIVGEILEELRMVLGDPSVRPQREFRKLGEMIEPTLETVERAARTTRRVSPLDYILGEEPEELTKQEKRALTRLRARDRKEKAKEARNKE